MHSLLLKSRLDAILILATDSHLSVMIIVDYLEERSGIHIILSKVTQVPVGLHSLQQTIMIIRGVICGTNLRA